MNQNNQWTSGLCSCMEDGNSVCLTCFLPCVTFGRIADIADEGKTGCGRCGIFYGLICFVVGLPCLFSCTYRTKIRSKFGLPESPYSDCLTHCFCECCALCQEYRELKNRGLDPSIGWSGNMQRMMAPPMDQHMNSDVNMGSKLADSKPASSKLVDSKSANLESASSKFADLKSASSKSANSKSADSKPVDSKPASLKYPQA